MNGQDKYPGLNNEEYKLVVAGQTDTALFKYRLRAGNFSPYANTIPNLEEALEEREELEKNED